MGAKVRARGRGKSKVEEKTRHATKAADGSEFCCDFFC